MCVRLRQRGVLIGRTVPIVGAIPMLLVASIPLLLVGGPLGVPLLLVGGHLR